MIYVILHIWCMSSCPSWSFNSCYIVSSMLSNAVYGPYAKADLLLFWIVCLQFSNIILKYILELHMLASRSVSTTTSIWLYNYIFPAGGQTTSVSLPCTLKGPFKRHTFWSFWTLYVTLSLEATSKAFHPRQFSAAVLVLFCSAT